ncbi:MAG: glycosyltransferase family 4 protein [Candidatus Kaiserbacteria bacterium]|nr:glycosyltransferase family 4 protein [Candidatus Kaiserbacteria bacterium]
MTVHFFTFSDEKSGTSRQRAFRVAEELNARGVHTVLHRPSAIEMSATPWPGKAVLIMQLLHALASVKKGDIVYNQRAISNKYFFTLLAAYVFLFRRTMIFDIDDPIFLHSFFKTMVFTRLADAVVVNHHTLADWVRRYNSNVHIVHISLNFADYKKFEHDYSAVHSPLVIGWVGTGIEHRFNLAFLADVFKELRADPSVPKFSFTLIGALKYQPLYDLFGSIPGLTTHFIDTLDWNDPQSVPREVQSFDIGVIPSATDPAWSKFKSSFKIIEYMACGVASIASDFGEMSYIIQDGTNGYLANDKKEWVEKLKKLLSDKELRTKLGKAGQKTVQENYCYDAIIPRMITLINSVSKSTIK